MELSNEHTEITQKITMNARRKDNEHTMIARNARHTGKRKRKDNENTMT